MITVTLRLLHYHTKINGERAVKKKNCKSRVITTDLAKFERKNRGRLLDFCDGLLLSVFFAFLPFKKH